jgi:hypothetical protein
VEVGQREKELANSLMLWTLKPAEDSSVSETRRIVLRLWNVANEPRVAEVKVGGLSSVQRVSHIETPLDPARVASRGEVEIVPGKQFSVSLAGQQMMTFLVEIAD